jgi:hypothetical protein
MYSTISEPSVRPAAREEHPASTGRSVPPVRLQPHGGCEDVNDAGRLSQDPTFRLIGSEKTSDRGAALTSRVQSFETEMLAEEENFAGLARINRGLMPGWLPGPRPSREEEL